MYLSPPTSSFSLTSDCSDSRQRADSIHQFPCRASAKVRPPRSQITYGGDTRPTGRHWFSLLSKRCLHDLEGWSLSTKTGQARYHIALGVYSRPAQSLMILAVFAYLCLGFAAVLFDMSVVCINPRHAMVETSAIQEERTVHSDVAESSKRLPSFHVMRKHAFRKTVGNAAHIGRWIQPHRLQLGGVLPSPASSTKEFDSEPVLLCDSLYATQASSTSNAVGLTCLLLCSMLLLENLLRLFAIGVEFIFHDPWLLSHLYLTAITFVTDVLIVFVLKPRLVLAFREDRKDELTMWIIFFCRLWRVNFLWRIIRFVRAEHSAGEEVIRVFEGMSLLLSQESGMSKSMILRVQVVKNSATESKLYKARRTTMKHTHGCATEQLLFFGPSRSKPSDIVDHEHGLDIASFAKGLAGDALYGMERPVFSDSCYAFTDWEQDPSGRTRQLIIFRALLGKVQEVDHEDSCGLQRPDLGYSSVLLGPCAPSEYQPGILGLKTRDVTSMTYAFHEPRGQVQLVAVVTYQNPDSFDEIDRMSELGVRSWGELCMLSQQMPSSTPDQAAALRDLDKAIDNRNPQVYASAMRRCEETRVAQIDIERVKRQRKTESEDAGISLAYILSEDFEKLAREAAGKEDPTFLELAEPLFKQGFGGACMGADMLCPRDLKPGCSFIDSLPQKYRKRATHFMSWVWRYNLSTVRSCLTRWAKTNALNLEDVFLYVCFFCNNQWRILVEKTTQATDNLEDVFEARLHKIGKAVALMDSWSKSTYIRRIWTIYEQYVIAKLGIQVQFALPAEPAETLIKQLDKGKQGLGLVIQAISNVDAESAEATMKQDEDKVKDLIRTSIGFTKVNSQVQLSITEWISKEFKAHIDRLVEASR